MLVIFLIATINVTNYMKAKQQQQKTLSLRNQFPIKAMFHNHRNIFCFFYFELYLFIFTYKHMCEPM